MTRRKTKPKDDNGADTSNDIDEIETVLKTVPEPTEVVSNDGDVPNTNDVMLPRSASRYVKPLR